MENSIKSRLSWRLTFALLFVFIVEMLFFAIYHFFEYWSDPDELVEDIGEFLVLSVFNSIGLIIMLLLARYLIKKELRPLEAAASTAAAIQNGQLSKRIEVKNPPEEIGHLAIAFNAAFDRYHVLLQKAEHFNADASHQLRTPLAVMRTTGEVALSQVREEGAYRDAIGSMLEETEHLQKIVTQLLELTKLSHKPPELVPVSVRPLLRRVIDRFSAVLEDFPDRVQAHCDDQITVLGNDVLLVEALSNLLDNALTHAHDQKEIHLEAFEEDGSIVLQVRDEGKGIPQENINRLSDRFYQCTSGSGQGSGLGLAIVKAIAELHGAALTITSAAGQGTSVRLYFPKPQR